MGIIVEYKGTNTRRVIEPVSERRVKSTRRLGSMISSVAKGPPRQDLWRCPRPTDLKCWKNQKKARKIWMRHPHRLRNPSIHSIADRYIYPDIVSNLEDFEIWWNWSF